MLMTLITSLKTMESKASIAHEEDYLWKFQATAIL